MVNAAVFFFIFRATAVSQTGPNVFTKNYTFFWFGSGTKEIISWYSVYKIVILLSHRTKGRPIDAFIRLTRRSMRAGNYGWPKAIHVPKREEENERSHRHRHRASRIRSASNAKQKQSNSQTTGLTV